MSPIPASILSPFVDGKVSKHSPRIAPPQVPSAFCPLWRTDYPPSKPLYIKLPLGKERRTHQTVEYHRDTHRTVFVPRAFRQYRRYSQRGKSVRHLESTRERKI